MLFRLVPKFAVTETGPPKVTLHVPVPLQVPPHPEKVMPESGVAVKVTCVLLANVAVQVDPQLMPDGLLVTVPVPVPAKVTVS